MSRSALRLWCTFWIVLALSSAAAAAQDARPGAEGRGLKLLQMQGCTACHSLDGGHNAGPTLAGRVNKKTRVVRSGTSYERDFDAAYLAHALAAPDDEVALGYPAGVMPAYNMTDEQRATLFATLAALPDPDAAPPSSLFRWVMLGLGSLLLATCGWWLRRPSR